MAELANFMDNSGEDFNSSIIFEHATIGIVIADQDGLIQAINPFAASMFGYLPEDLITKPIEILIPSRYRERHVDHRTKYVHLPQNRPMGLGMVLFGVRANGEEFPVEISLGFKSDGEDKKVVAFVSDITIRKQIESEIQELNSSLENTIEKRTEELQHTLKELEHARNEIEKALIKEKELSDLKSRLVTMASHEFRTPLGGIQSSGFLIKQYLDSGDYEKQRSHIQRIQSNVKQLTELLDDFLDVSKLDEGKIELIPEQHNVADFFKFEIEAFENQKKKGQLINYDHSGDELFTIDKKVLRHIIQNLISNAIKFSPENSIIEIGTSIMNKEMEIIITDHGIGISEDDKKHLKERFYRGSNATNIKGTGLGLNLIALYLEMIGGQMEVQSELDKGSTFIVKIPMS